MKRIKLYSSLIFGLIIQGGEQQIEDKNKVLRSLYEKRDDHPSFIKELTENKCLFRDKNDGLGTTCDARQLIAAVEERPELISMIAVTYYGSAENIGIQNLLQCLLAKERIANLATIAKDGMLTELHKNIDKHELFIKGLKEYGNMFMFAEKNEKYQPTYNTRKLIAAVEERPELMHKIAIKRIWQYVYVCRKE